jgi:hypothetical protein
MADFIPIPGDSIKLERCCKVALNTINAAIGASNKVDNITNLSTLAQVILSGNIPEAIYNLQGGFVDCERIAKQMNVIGNMSISRAITIQAFVDHPLNGERLHTFWTNLGRAFGVEV